MRTHVAGIVPIVAACFAAAGASALTPYALNAYPPLLRPGWKRRTPASG